MADDRINNNASLSLMYMNYLKLQTIHEEYNAEEEVIIEKEEIKNGKNIEISLEVNDISDKISATEKEKIEKSSNDTVFMYLDINILKKIGSDTLTKITNTKKPIKISIVIPDESINTKTNLKRKFKIIRLHDGVISELDAELNGNILTFETDQFSTYALAYVDTDLNPIKNPKTGDNAYIYIFILILSIIGLRTGMKRLI